VIAAVLSGWAWLPAALALWLVFVTCLLALAATAKRADRTAAAWMEGL